MRCEWSDHFGHRCSPNNRVVTVFTNNRAGPRHKSDHRLCENAIKEVVERGHVVKDLYETPEVLAR